MSTTQKSTNANENATENANIELVKKKSKKPRCFHCNKKVGLTAIQCKCGNIYCNKCRYPLQHNCTYDYKKDQPTNLVNCQFKKMVDKL